MQTRASGYRSRSIVIMSEMLSAGIIAVIAGAAYGSGIV
jgi:hypothetical protein